LENSPSPLIQVASSCSSLKGIRFEESRFLPHKVGSGSLCHVSNPGEAASQNILEISRLRGKNFLLTESRKDRQAKSKPLQRIACIHPCSKWRLPWQLLPETISDADQDAIG
jgi:hypothetical protein